MEEEEIIDIFQSELVPKHDVLTEDEKAGFLKDLNITTKQLPKISQDDPVVKRLNAKKGDVIKITRDDPAVGEYYYYRVVV
ncbi:MAG: DNA-directed RNA polymerase subunit H [Candidatus Aenigmatarchaeota archaeon]